MTIGAFRPLTQEEERLLRRILENGSVEARSYLSQIPGLRARPSCECGCPSISLVVLDDAAAVTHPNERIVGDLSGQTEEGLSVGVLLFQDEGKLSELEIYPYDDAGQFGLPLVESLGGFQTEPSS